MGSVQVGVVPVGVVPLVWLYRECHCWVESRRTLAYGLGLLVRYGDCVHDSDSPVDVGDVDRFGRCGGLHDHLSRAGCGSGSGGGHHR